jgi:hypothetical protein
MCDEDLVEPSRRERRDALALRRRRAPDDAGTRVHEIGRPVYDDRQRWSRTVGIGVRRAGAEHHQRCRRFLLSND